MGNSNFDNKIHVVAGSRGRGKTSFSETLLKIGIKKGLKPIIYDPRRDFIKYFSAEFLPRNLFKERYLVPAKNSVILLEESTVFFPNSIKDSVLMDKLIAARYDKNDIILVYHSLQDIPAYVLRQSDYFTLFKTADNPQYIKSNFKGFQSVIENFDFVYENAGNDEKKLGDKPGFYNFKNTVRIN